MRLTIDLPTDLSFALKNYAHDFEVTPEYAALVLLRKALDNPDLSELEEEAPQSRGLFVVK